MKIKNVGKVLQSQTFLNSGNGSLNTVEKKQKEKKKDDD